MKEITLPNGMITAVDDEDFERLSVIKWTVIKSSNHYYIKGLGKDLYCHILTAPEGLAVDHINGNVLDNRRCNLRIVTRQQNQWNRKPANNRAYKGVHSRTYNGKTQHKVTIKKDGKTKYITTTNDLGEAIRAYDAKAIEIQGEFARLNFPEGYEHILPDHLIERFRAEKRGIIKHPEDYLNA